jgi:hypothetical protein
MTAITYQRVLARLVVDEVFYQRFCHDRAAALEALALDGAEREGLFRLDAGSVDTFRAVVRGSRVRQFALFFDKLHGLLDEKAWGTLVNRFQSEVVILDSSRFHDAELFCEWLDREFPSSIGAELTRYNLRLLQIDAPSAAVARPGTLKKHRCVETLVIARPFDRLIAANPNDHLWAASMDPSSWHYILKGTMSSRDVEVIEATPIAHRFLEVLRTPRTEQELFERCATNSELFSEILSTLKDAGLVVSYAE